MKNTDRLRKLRKKLFFNTGDISRLLGITAPSARVMCSRYVTKGIFLRLKKDFYVSEEKWDTLSGQDFFKIANFLQVPSYISFMSALSFYGVTTQLQRDFYENASIKRSVRFTVKGAGFHFYKLKKEYYFGFVRREGLFIATKEKAFVDSVYLYSVGKYKPDFSSLDTDKLDRKKVREILKKFPAKTGGIVKRLCAI
ncbi:MAG: hypothetical protein JW976_00220 [Syntrophaceae bacterium]|nr:hypothetical protein [Syntrophaceae bacterium]